MKKYFLILQVLFLMGCAVGNEYNYRSSSIAFPIKPENHKTLILSVEDFRPYILNGDKDPSFVGLQRGGFGNPFDVTTSTGNPMTDDMAAAIEQGLMKVGYKVINAKGKKDKDFLKNTAVQTGATRIVSIKVYDWKSDIFMSITLHCDLRLEVLDASGETLATSAMKFKEEVGGALTPAKNSEAMAEEFAKRIGYLFNKEEVRHALQ